MYDKYTAVCPRCFFLVMHPNIAFLGENKKRAKCEHTQNTSRHLAPDFGRYNPQDSHVRQVRVGRQIRAFSHYASKYRVFKNVWFVRSVLIQALTCCVTEREEQRRRGRERRAPDESTKLRVRSVFFAPTQRVA